jgi:hypothetical protein
MFRFVLSAMALAGILATTLPAFADQATAADHARVATAATVPSALPAPARASSAAPKPDGHDTEFPVGPGWG